MDAFRVDYFLSMIPKILKLLRRCEIFSVNSDLL